MSAIKVIVAEDHIITSEGICRLLEDERNIDVVGKAYDGEEAVRMVKKLQPDVILMDIALPKLNGLEATKQIKVISPTTAILILSAYDDDEYVFGLLEAGAAGYLLKTTGGADLVNAIRAVHKGEPILDPKITLKVINRLKTPGKDHQHQPSAKTLSERELEIIKLAAKGMSNRDIADRLHLSRRTIEGNLRTIFNKLGVGSRTEAVIQAIDRDLFSTKELS